MEAKILLIIISVLQPFHATRINVGLIKDRVNELTRAQDSNTPNNNKGGFWEEFEVSVRLSDTSNPVNISLYKNDGKVIYIRFSLAVFLSYLFHLDGPCSFLCHQHLCCVAYTDCFVISFCGVGVVIIVTLCIPDSFSKMACQI